MSDKQVPSPVDGASEQIPDTVAAAMFGVQRPSSGGGWEPPLPEELQLSFGQYEIRDILGRGGMGAVYKAWHKRLERFVAIKILPSQIDDGGMNFAERFKQEAAAMAKFRHPGIVAVYDAGETQDGLLYFTMELVEGTDVAQLIADRGRLPVAQALAIATRVCEALVYSHECGVIHRDIKPSNVMIEADGTVKVADFGLAKFSGAEKHVTTGSGLSIGTPDFMPPEAIQGSHHVDHRGDIYATGGLLYQMLTGKAPHGRFQAPSMVVVGLDKRLDTIVDKAMHVDLGQRYASATEFLSDLQQVAATLPKPATDGAQTPGEPRRRGTAKLVTAALLVTVLLGIAAIAFGPWKKSGVGVVSGGNAEATSPVAIRREWKAAPAKFNAVIDRDAVHLQRFDTWGTGNLRKTNVAVRSTIAWQPSPPGRNELIKVTARWTDTEHYYACLYGSVVELGHYRAPDVTPLQRWAVDPPPGADESVSLQLACVGNRLAVWVRDRLVGIMDDDSVTGLGKVGVQAVDGHIRSLDYLDLDGLSPAAAFQELGLDATGTSAIRLRDWVKVFPDLSKLPGLAEFSDGWARMSAEAGITHLRDAGGNLLVLHNGGLRAQRRVPDGWRGGILLHVRSVEGGRRLNLCYYEPKAPGEKAYLQLRQFQPETLPPDATAEQAWSAQKLLAEARIPPLSGEIATELIVVGSTAWGRMGEHVVTATFEDDGKSGRLALDEANTLFFRDVAVLNLDSLAEAEALKSAGMKASPGQPIVPLSLLTPGESSKNVPYTSATIAPWHDALAESPLKDVVAKAEHTAQGYRLPDNNHWIISPQPQRSGAVRVRAAGVNAQFVSLFALLEDRQAERLRFRDMSKQWKLSKGEVGVDETDFASAPAASPLDGKPHELLFARFGGHLRAMLDGHLLMDEADPSSVPGNFVLDVYRRATVWVEKVEYLELDGVAETEALKLIGLDADGKELPATTGVPSSVAKANVPKTEAWVDLLRPEAAAMLDLVGIEKPGPEGLVVPANGKATVAGTGGITTSDGALRFRARFEPVSKGRVSLRVRSTAGPAYGLVVINRAKLVLQVWRGNQVVDTLKEFDLSDPLEEGQDYEMELRAVGSTLTARLNGKTLGQIEDTTHPMGAFQVRGAKGEPITIRALEFLDLSASASVGANERARSSESEFATATKEKPFVNSLGMKFVPVPIIGGPTDGKRVLFNVWETRVQDYAVFAREAHRAWQEPKFEQGLTHPVVKVSWDDAQAFCSWLTEHERKAGRLGATEIYRLPTDHEWSCAVGIGDREDPRIGPARNSGNLADIFPWGTVWPPPPGAGNYSGEEAAGHEMAPDQRILAGYRDDFPETAPVGSFAANPLGIFDLGGNVWEWCEDRWKDGEPSRVVRGASCGSTSRSGLLSSARDFNPPEARNSSFGFRVVIGASDVSVAKGVTNSSGAAKGNP